MTFGQLDSKRGDWGDLHDVSTCFRVVQERYSLGPKMSRKGSEESSDTPSVVRRKRDERFSSGSSPEVPPTKSAKQTLEELSNNENNSNVWIVLNKIRRNTDELLEENHAMRRQYEELKQSLNFNNAELTSLRKENKELKDKVSSLEKSLSEVRADVDILYEDLGTAITQVDDVEQYTRKHNLEIHEIAETADEYIAENVVKLGKVVNVHISSSDIDICHRMGPRNSSAPNLLLLALNHIRRKLSCTKLGNI